MYEYEYGHWAAMVTAKDACLTTKASGSGDADVIPAPGAAVIGRLHMHVYYMCVYAPYIHSDQIAGKDRVLRARLV